MSIILRDYQHARKAFIDQTGITLIPKSQFLFHVYIELNPAVGDVDPNQAKFSILVKSIDLPKYTVETKTFNAYNRPNIVQTKITYEPITIKFHDDSSNIIRNLWKNYYQFYYKDSRLGINNNGDVMSTYLQKHKYQDNIPLGFGYDPSKENNGLVNFIKSIKIYSLHAGQHSSYVLVNPIIKRFNHGNHDYEQSATLEHEMTVSFETVLYSSGGDIKQVKGFTTVGYDNYKSPLETGQENTGKPDAGKLMPSSRSLNGDMDQLMNNRPELVADEDNNGEIDLVGFNVNQNGIDVSDPRLSGVVSENFAGIDVAREEPSEFSSTDPAVYDSNPVTQALYSQTTSKGLPLLNPTNIPTTSPSNLLTADRVAFSSQGTNQQGFPDNYTNILNTNNLNNKISDLSANKNFFSQQTINANSVLSMLENKKSAVASLPQTSNNKQLQEQITAQIADTQNTKNLNQNQVSYYNNEIDSASSDLIKYIE